MAQHVLLITFSFGRKNRGKVIFFPCICFLQEKEFPKSAFIFSFQQPCRPLERAIFLNKASVMALSSETQMSTSANILMKRKGLLLKKNKQKKMVGKLY